MKLVKKAFVNTIPVLTGYVVLAIGFGIMLHEAGFGVIWALLMSLTIYAGSMQYMAVSLIVSQASLLTFGLTTLMVNARHLFYGISMIDKYKNVGKKKPYMIFALTDETYSLVCEDMPDIQESERARYCFLVSLFNHAYWVLGTLVGSLLGKVLPFDAKGIDFALTALFITIFTEQWLQSRNHIAAVIGVLASALCLVLLGKESFLIPAMVLITVLLLLTQKSIVKKGGAENE